MCGIAGAVSLRADVEPIALEPLGRMATALHHRGPDERGIYRDAQAGLAHTRLSIIDLATGQQPMRSSDGRYVLVYNGEVFNYVELRAELEAAGCRFATASDTEVVLQALVRWGHETALPRFNGQFAIAFWDRHERRLLLARDPLGIRPLFWAKGDDRLWFASEVKAMFAGEPALRRGLSSAGLAQTFTFWASIAPRSVFEGVEELCPGSWLVLREGCISQGRYFDLSYPESSDDNIEASVERVHDTLGRASRLRMLRSDVPVGSYLSGGIDSSIIAALARESIDRFHTFSLRFADAEYDETKYQRLMVERLGSEHHEVVVQRRDIADAFPDVVYHAERPMLRSAPTPLMLLSRLVRDTGIKVVLTGEGADEMFGGYDIFREAKVRRFWARAPSSTSRPRLLEKLYPYLARSPVRRRAMAQKFFGRDLDKHAEPGFGHGPRWNNGAPIFRLLTAERRGDLQGHDLARELVASLPEGLRSWSPLAQDQYIEIKTLLSGYLLSTQGDRMLMASSVEGRFPFLDADVVRTANDLPARHKVSGLDEKHVLKKLCRSTRAALELVPPDIVDRKKQPYRAPDALSFAAPGGGQPPEWIAEVLAPSALESAGAFSSKPVELLWNKCVKQAAGGQLSNADNQALLAVLSTQLLHHRLLATDLSGSCPPKLGELTTQIDTLASTSA